MFSFEFITIERPNARYLKRHRRGRFLESSFDKNKDNRESLISLVRDFIRDSQINYSSYFSRDKDEPDLFDRILRNLDDYKEVSASDLLKRVKNLAKAEETYKIDELGLAKEKWDRRSLTTRIKSAEDNQNKLSIIASYLEVLEARNEERINLAERLLTFERELNELLLDKTIKIDSRGFNITLNNDSNYVLDVEDLSTGEFHLLYLTVLALCTKVKGTIIAIDEPEMSMHIAWQAKLIKVLTRISSKASPQMIFATHSPDIAANFSNSLKTEKYGE